MQISISNSKQEILNIILTINYFIAILSDIPLLTYVKITPLAHKYLKIPILIYISYFIFKTHPQLKTFLRLQQSSHLSSIHTHIWISLNPI